MNIERIREWPEIYSVRHERFRSLVKQLGSLQAIIAEGAKRGIELSPSHLSQINTKTRGIGEQLARKLERAVGKPKGWLDTSRRSVEELSILEAYWSVPEMFRGEIFNLLRGVADELIAAWQKMQSEQEQKNRTSDTIED
jgi:hypothetical protein